MTYLDRASALLAAIRGQGRYREVRPRARTGVLDFSSNDYLALATHPQVVEAFRRASRVGAGGARLLGGAHREQSLLEEELAAWLGRERVLLFSSGYLAALGATAVLSRTVDYIYSDRLNHASLIDGVRGTKIHRFIYDHAALPAHRRGNALVVTESIFGMDGDAIDLERMLGQLEDGDVLLIDEAHALGVTGERGAGLARELGDPRVVILGTLSKAFGGLGGFIAGPAAVIDLLVNEARTFIFDTALPPAIALAARVALTLIRDGDEARARLHGNVAHLRAGLRSLGLPAIDGPSPVVPVLLGSEDRAVEVARCLEGVNIHAPAIRPPTVPKGSSRLRLSVRSDHQREHIDLLVQGLAKCIATS